MELEVEDGVECDECFDCSSSVFVLRRGKKREAEKRKREMEEEGERSKREQRGRGKVALVMTVPTLPWDI